MSARAPSSTLFTAPALVAVALVIAVAPFERVLGTSSAPSPTASSPVRVRTSAAWFEAGPVHVDALLSRPRLVRGSEGSVFLDLKLRAANAAFAEGRPPVDLAVALDVSGAIGPEKLGLMAETCRWLAGQLGEDDRIAVVAFSDQAATVVSLDGKQHDSLVAPGGTNVALGLESAAHELRRAARPGAARRLLLVTDGRPNRGIVSPDELAGLAAGLAREGISVSTVGLGLDYDDALLASVADVGGGTYHHVETADRVQGIFEAELRSLRAIVAKGVRVRLEPAPGVELAEIVGWKAVRDGDGLSVRVGDFEAGREAKVVARLRVPTSSEALALDVVRVSVEATDARREMRLEPPPAELALALTSSEELDKEIGALKTLTTSQSVFREGDKDEDAVAPVASAAPAPAPAPPAMVTVLGNGAKQGYVFQLDAQQVTELEKDLSDAAVASDLERARTCAAKGDREGARAALESVKHARPTLSYTSADGRTEKKSVDDLEREITSDASETRARAVKFAASAVQSAR
jgi:hypothetical protein